ncbi:MULTISPECIES: hypothetical protein [Oscillatoriales]|uniref:hypothetical protein n=1 Tax=Oscillatoriales TaxID=1150 RepID=UPI00130532DA|nr:hypothetical protein [Arthrospira platensis]MDF2207861.1 hypothetical protein [Arthrospira platensis NCB002]QQW28188.1 hypothetical protein AP9108_24450 [Arthrospira sp. PCC 9108]
MKPNRVRDGRVRDGGVGFRSSTQPTKVECGGLSDRSTAWRNCTYIHYQSNQKP